ncbi:unnamed protein product [Dimorphilus gyrociliatus]|uniref:RBR-type E3 ubiquitin transferase n=1 Tax=Dimorphilus gyrociliatus TaxID=2664684 RepID=A0A7I8V7Y0_9ANNE|nr:unnamed protein product [Dimorphilus gyrociliatus]
MERTKEKTKEMSKWRPNLKTFIEEGIDKGLAYEAAIAASIIYNNIGVNDFFLKDWNVLKTLINQDDYGILTAVKMFIELKDSSYYLYDKTINIQTVEKINSGIERISTNTGRDLHPIKDVEGKLSTEKLGSLIFHHCCKDVYVHIGKNYYMNAKTSDTVEIRDEVLTPEFISFPLTCKTPIRVESKWIQDELISNDIIRQDDIDMIKDEFEPLQLKDFGEKAVGGKLCSLLNSFYSKEKLEKECSQVCGSRQVIWFGQAKFKCPKNYHSILKEFLEGKLREIGKISSFGLTFMTLSPDIDVCQKHGFEPLEAVVEGDFYSIRLLVDKATACLYNPTTEKVKEKLNKIFGNVTFIHSNEYSIDDILENDQEELEWGFAQFESKCSPINNQSEIMGMRVIKEKYIDPIKYLSERNHISIKEKLYSYKDNILSINKELFSFIKTFLKDALFKVQNEDFFNEGNFLVRDNAEIEIIINNPKFVSMRDVFTKLIPLIKPDTCKIYNSLFPLESMKIKLNNWLKKMFNTYTTYHDNLWYVYGSRSVKKKVIKYLYRYEAEEVKQYHRINLELLDTNNRENLRKIQKVTQEIDDGYFEESHLVVLCNLDLVCQIQDIVLYSERTVIGEGLNCFSHLVDIIDIESVDSHTDRLDWNDESKCDECVVCFQVPNQSTRLINCGHSYCTGCFKQQLNVNITQSLKLPITCAGCDESINNLEIVYSEKKQQFRVQGEIYKILVQKFKEFTFCPGLKCSNGLVYSKGKTPMQCISCKCEVCSNCKELHLEGEDCFSQRQMFQREYKLWCLGDIVNRKICPSCSYGIEKEGGCNLVWCRSCSKSICWYCLDFFENKHLCYSHLSTMHGGYA